jgi:hypothetical protein
MIVGALASTVAPPDSRPTVVRQRDVERHAGLGERGQLGGEHHRGDVLALEVGRIDGDAEPLEHLGQRALDDRRLRVVAGAVEPDHQAEPGEVVVAHAGDRGEVLDPIGVGGCEPEREGEGQGGEDRGDAHGNS